MGKDTWLLFNLLYPGIVVLVHTYMDTLREDEDREINHHGKTVFINCEPEENEHARIKVKPAIMNLVSVNKKEELKAQKVFHEKIDAQMRALNMRKLEFWKKMSLVYLPV